jgi:hypothetical protein
VQWTFSTASAMPRKGTAYRSIPALEGRINLIVLSTCGRIAKGELFDEITELHKLGEMGRLHKTLLLDSRVVDVRMSYTGTFPCPNP